MGFRRIDWSQVHQKRSNRPFYLIMGLFSRLYSIAGALRLRGYETGFLKKMRLPGFVLSIGNITAGGTGKTPAVIMIAGWALRQGLRPAVLSRGYGGSYGSKVLQVSDCEKISATANEAGDEPLLLAKALPGVPVVLSKRRYPAGMYASKKFGSDFFVLDDGFQHMALERDIDMVLLDAESPFGNGYLLPRGPLREPLKNLGRADAICLTRASETDSGMADTHLLPDVVSGKPVFYAGHVPEKVVFPNRKEEEPVDFLKGKRVVAFAGIGNPLSFKKTLERQGASIIKFERFADHHPFDRREVDLLALEVTKTGADCLITTEKDWVRLSGTGASYPSISYLSVRFEILSDKDGFFEFIKNEIKRK